MGEEGRRRLRPPGVAPAAARPRFRARFSAGLGIGLLAGIFLALLVTQCSRKDAATTEGGELDDLVLGKVAGTEFTVADLRKKLKYQYSRVAETGIQGISEQRQIVSSAIDEWCWVKYGEKKGYDKDPQFRDTWELSRRYILAGRTIDFEVRAHETPTEEEIQAYYAEHQSEYKTPTRVQVAHVQTRTKAEAEAARRRLVSGEIPGEVARAMTIDETTRANGGLIGWITATSSAGHLGAVPAINEAAMELQKGEVSPPVQLPEGRGWTVLVALDRTEEGPRPLDETVREMITRRVQTKKHNDLFGQLLGRLKNEYGAELYEENFQRYAASVLSEEELFMYAQREKDVAKRVTIYKTFVEEHPDSPYAAQAEFMVAFTQADEQKLYDEARESFRAFLKKYPGHELAASAQWMIENMEEPTPDVNALNELRRRVLTSRPSGK